MSIHMGIPRYDIYERPGDDDPLDECARGRVVLYSDHLTDKQAALDAQQAAHAAEVERLTAERDAAVARAERAEIVVEVSRRVLEDGESDMDADKGMACVGTVLLHELHDAIAALDQNPRGGPEGEE